MEATPNDHAHPPPPAAPVPDPATGERLARIEATLAALVPTSHAQAQAHTEARLSRPDDVQQQVQAALRQADRDRTERESRDQAKQAAESLDARLKKLEETKPESVIRGIERFMGWTGPAGG
jgi:hypothetical protein